MSAKTAARARARHELIGYLLDKAQVESGEAARFYAEFAGELARKAPGG